MLRLTFTSADAGRRGAGAPGGDDGGAKGYSFGAGSRVTQPAGQTY